MHRPQGFRSSVVAVGYLFATAVLGAAQYLGVQLWTVPHARLVGGWIPLAYVVCAVLIVGLAHRWKTHQVVLVLDLTTWIIPLTLLIQAPIAPGIVRVSLPVMLSLKVALLLLIGAQAIARSRLTDTWAGWFLCGVSVLFFVAPLPFTRMGLGLKGDEPHYLVATVSLLRDGDLFLEDEYAHEVYAPFYDGDLRPGHVIAARDGHLASPHDAGLSIVAMIPYALGGWVLVLVVMAGLAGLAVREVFISARLLGAGSLAALAAAVFIGFSPPFAVYATQLYPEIPAALVTAFALRQMIGAVGRRHAPLVIGLSLATLPWLHFRFWVLALPLALTALMIWPNVRTGLVVLSPVAISGTAYVFLIYLVYGRLAPTPFLLQSGLFRSLSTASGLVGIPALVLTQTRPWLDSYDGLLLLSPIYLYALAALPSLLKSRSWIGGGLVTTVGFYSTLISFWYLHSTAGDSPPGRFMVAVLPLLGVAMGCQMQRQSRRVTLALVIPLGIVSAASTLISMSDPLLARYPYGGQGGPIAILGRLVGIRTSSILPTFSSPSPGSFAKVALALVLTGLLAAVMYRVPAPTGRQVRPGASRRRSKGWR